jgi:hypothetical protein
MALGFIGKSPFDHDRGGFAWGDGSECLTALSAKNTHFLQLAGKWNQNAQ